MGKLLKDKFTIMLMIMALIMSYFSPISIAEGEGTPTSITVSPASLTLEQGGVQQLYGSVFDEAYHFLFSEPVSWASSDNNVVEVSNSGIVTAVSPGSATITATSESNRELKATSTITVQQPSQQGITVYLRVEGINGTIVENTPVTLPDTTATDNEGRTHDYGMFTPYAALTQALNNQDILYDADATAAPYVQTIDGTTAAHFHGYDGWLYKIIRQGSLESDADSLGMSQFSLEANDQIIIYYGDWGIPTAAIEVNPFSPKVGEPITVTVNSLTDDTPIPDATGHFGQQTETTDEQGKATFTPENNGRITIYAEKANTQGKPLIVRSAKQEIMVAEQPASSAASVSVSPDNMTLYQGGEQKLFATVLDNQYNFLFNETVTWTSSDQSVATIDSSGILTAHAPGSATITATVDSKPELIATSSITVQNPAAQGITVYLQVEGSRQTIVEKTAVTLNHTSVTDNGNQTHDYGMFTPYGALLKVLNDRAISYDGDATASPYVQTIADDTAAQFHGYDGWMYKIIRNGEVDLLADNLGMSQFPLQAGDHIVVYYGDWGAPIASLDLDKTTVDVNQPITATVTNLVTGAPLEGISVFFGTQEKITDAQGHATFTPPSTGTFTVFAEKKDPAGKPVVVRFNKITLHVEASLPLHRAIDKLLAYYREQTVPASDWEAFGLNAIGEDIHLTPYVGANGQSYAHTLLQANPSSVTDIARTILGILSAGYNPADFNGKNYIHELGQKDIHVVNGAIFELIALDAAGVEPDFQSQYTKDELIQYILTHDRFGKGWNFNQDAERPDPDLTSMALIALAPYKDRADVSPVISQAVEALAELQQEDGGYRESVTNRLNSQSVAQVIQAFTALGIDPQGPAFTKTNGQNPVTNLLSYQLADGAFGNVEEDGHSNAMATEQALNALAALRQYEQSGKSTLFQNITYAGGTAPDLGVQTKPFSITTTPLKMEGGLLNASATVTPVEGGHAGTEYVVFQLTKDNQPQSIVAIKKDITAPEEVTAYFNVQQGSFKVKVFLLDSLTGSDQLGESLSDIKILE